LKIVQKIKASVDLLGVVESASGVPPVISPLHLWREKGSVGAGNVLVCVVCMITPCVRVANLSKIGLIDRQMKKICSPIPRHPAEDEARKHFAATIRFQ
jgi:hypothetical protein